MVRPVERIAALAVVVFGLSSCKGCDADKAAPPPEPSARDAATAPTPSANTTPVMAKIALLAPKLDACNAIDAGAGAIVLRVAKELRVELTIEPDGKVAAAKITSRGTASEPTAGCVRDVLEHERFDPPANGSRLVVNVPVRLSGSGQP